MNAGYYDIPMSEYLADPAPEPSLSTGPIHLLTCGGTPRKAFAEHPRLGKKGSAPSSRGEIGSAIHSLALGGADVVFAPDEFEDWRKKDAQSFRDEAREAGQLPLLAKQRSQVLRAADQAREILSSFGPGKPEQTLLFQHNGVWCRGRSDWLTDDCAYDFDIKTCDSADEETWVRQCVESQGYDIQAALRSMGHLSITGKPRKMLWLLVEFDGADPDCNVVEPAPSMLALAERKVNFAAAIWRRCLDEGVWPGYSREIKRAEVSPWAEQKFAQRTGVVPG